MKRQLESDEPLPVGGYLGTGSGQRPYGSYPVKLTVRSTMGTTGPQVPITLSVLYAPSIAQVYLPNLAAGVSTSGQ